MLRKLIKHEWTASWKVYGIINLYMIIVTFFSVVTAVLTFKQKDPNEFVIMFTVMTLILYYFSLIGVNVAPNLYSAVRYYKNFYANEGYLMHTLPVTKHQLICSKTIVALIWMLISIVVGMCSIVTVGLSILYTLERDIEWGVFWEEFHKGVAVIQNELKTPIIVFIIAFIIIFLIGLIVGILNFYTCISLGQLAKKHKILVSIAIYIGLQTVTQIFGCLLQVPLMMLESDIGGEFVVGPDAILWGVIGIAALISLIMAVAYYAICYFIMKKKINLD